MKSCQFALVGLACLAAAGCRTDPNIALLERDLRLQEDEIYRLEDCIEDYQASLQSCRQENAALRKRLGNDRIGADLPVDPSPPEVILQPGGPAEWPSLQPPVIELPRETPAEDEVPDTTAPDTTSPVLPADSSQVSRLTLNPSLTGGYDADGRPGDEGITVVIEPRDAQGRWTEAPADVSVVVLDPASYGEAARVARWDFTLQETAAMFRKSGLGRGIQLEMVWPAGPPVHGNLHLFVRYTTSDGRKLEFDQPIRIELPDGASPAWVPAEPRPTELQASRPSEYPTLPPSPKVRTSDSPSSYPAAEPARPEVARPAWSPGRP